MANIFKSIQLPVRLTGLMVRLTTRTKGGAAAGASAGSQQTQAFGAYVYMPLSHRPDIDH